MRNSDKKNGESAQELDALVKRRKWKNRLSIAAAAAVVVAIASVSVGSYVKTRQSASGENEDEFGYARNRGGNLGAESGAVAAAGVTSAGMKAVIFEIDFLEEARLYVEKVYPADGDSVKAGDKYIKFTDESIADAREELEEAKLSAQLACRSGKITDGESRLKAKHTYNVAMLEAQSASQVYDDTIAQLEADYAQAAKAYDEVSKEYDEYLERVQNNSFYEYYGIASLKKAYEDAKELYISQKEHYEVTDEEMQESTTENTNASTNVSSALQGGTVPKGFGGMSKQSEEERAVQMDRAWIIKAMKLLSEEAEEAEQEYETALAEYEDEIAVAQLKLQKLQNELETAREDFTDAEILYKKSSLNAKTAYETALAKGKTSQADYETQLAGLEDSLKRLYDASDEAEKNLALFEELVGDGYLYMEESGTVRMLAAEEGKALTGGSMIFAYSDPEQILVSVSVGQNDIAKLYVGEAASVEISDRGNYSGVIETINPISSSNGRSAASYTVTVCLQGDVKGLDSNLTANVVFGEAQGGQSARSGQKEGRTNDAQNEGQRGSLKTGVTESGTVEFGITSQIYDLDVSTDDDSGGEDDGDGGKYLEIEEVYAAVGQRVQKGDKVYRFTSDSIASVRKALEYEKTKAQLALSAAQTEYETGVLAAELSRDETLLDTSLAQTSYETAIARLSNDMSAKSLEIEQLLKDIYKLQCDLTDEDYLEEKSDIAEAYEKAVKGVEAAAEDFVTSRVDAAEAFEEAKTSYEQFFAQIDESNQQIQDKLDEVYEIQEEIAYSRSLMEKELLAARQKLDMSAVSGQTAGAKYQSSLESYANTLQKAQREFEEASKKLDEFDEFAGDGNLCAEGSGIVTEIGYKVGDRLINAGTLISFANPDDMTVSVDVSQEDIVAMKVGDAVEIRLSAYNDSVYNGRIEAIAAAATSRSSSTVSYTVSVSIQGDTSKLYDGMTADVTFAAQETESSQTPVQKGGSIENKDE